ncbi:hypothetical protein Tco_0042956 [Tanacetum coccineum]
MADDQGILRSISRCLGKAASGWHLEDVFTRSRGGSHDGRSSRHSQEDEEALRWAALEKLPTFNRLRTTIFKSYLPGDQKDVSVEQMLLDVRDLDPDAQQNFIDKIFRIAEEDNEIFLRKFRDRIDK